MRKEEQFSKLSDVFSLPLVVLLSFFCSERSPPTVCISQVFARKEVQFSEKCWLFFVVSEGFGAAFTSKSLLAQYRPVWFHVTVFKELGPVNFTSRSFGAVFVNLLFAQYRPSWIHLPATVKSPRVMCLMNCLCLFPTGFSEGNNLVTAFMIFFGKVIAVTVCLCPCLLASHASETSPCLSLRRCSQARG